MATYTVPDVALRISEMLKERKIDHILSPGITSESNWLITGIDGHSRFHIDTKTTVGELSWLIGAK